VEGFFCLSPPAPSDAPPPQGPAKAGYMEFEAASVERRSVLNLNRPRVACSVHDPNRPRSVDGARQFFRPLNRQHAVSGDLVEPEIVDLAGIVQAIEVDVEQRQPSAAIFLHDRERWAADV